MLANQGLAGEALRLLSRHLAENASDADAARVASDLHLKMGNQQAAIETLSLAHEAAPDDDDLTFRLARALALASRTQEAIDHLSALLERTPSALMPLRLHAELCFQTGQLQFALESFTRLCELKPRSPEGHLNRVRCLHTLLMPGEAIQAARDGLDRCPNSIDLRLALAQVLFDQGNDELALEVYDEILKGQEHAGALIGKGRCLQRIADARCPETVARRRAIEIALERHRVYRLLASVQHGSPLVSVETLRAGLAASTDTGESRGHACIELAQCLDKIDSFDDAYDMVEEAPGTRPRTHRRCLSLARLRITTARIARESPSASQAARWGTQASKSNGRTAPAFLVGFPRSGTTLVEQMIGSLNGWITSDEKPMLAQLEGTLARRWASPSAICAHRSTDSPTRTSNGPVPGTSSCASFISDPMPPTRGSLISNRTTHRYWRSVGRFSPKPESSWPIRDRRLLSVMQSVTPNRSMRHYPAIDAVAKSTTVGALPHRPRTPRRPSTSSGTGTSSRTPKHAPRDP
ncbi:MAG: tetratricopeptide repeat protein [Phycisphaerales bacterium]